MCGIVGLFLKEPGLEPELGRMTAAMLGTMSARGPDSAGFAVYGDGDEGWSRLSLRGATPDAVLALQEPLRHLVPTASFSDHDTHTVLAVPQDREAAVLDWLAEHAPGVDLVGRGQRMRIFKEVGRPENVTTRFGLGSMTGTHAIGHTRMATESAVTTEGAHPYSTGRDQCLVHNGSLSNHNSVRRRLQREGIRFRTENDTEVAAGYLTWRMREGMSLGGALEASLGDLDGFYTFVVGTKTGFGVLRDAVACKPAVMAETDEWVAFGSEYRALAVLPGIEAAHVFEPEPSIPYFWER